jgi:hypothetical protein
MKRFFPGNLVPRSGIYIAIHPKHRLVHEVTVTKGSCFPLCRICGPGVNFQLWTPKKAGAAKNVPKVLVPFSLETHGYEGLAI